MIEIFIQILLVRNLKNFDFMKKNANEIRRVFKAANIRFFLAWRPLEVKSLTAFDLDRDPCQEFRVLDPI